MDTMFLKDWVSLQLKLPMSADEHALGIITNWLLIWKFEAHLIISFAVYRSFEVAYVNTTNIR